MGRILVGDDDPGVRETLERILTLREHTVLLAEDGEAVLRIVRSEPVDLLILDVFMPEQDGLGVLRVLRAEGFTSPILMLSGGGSIPVESALRMAAHLGATSLMEKPIKALVLISEVERMLE